MRSLRCWALATVLASAALAQAQAGQADALRAMVKNIPMARVGRPEEIADAVLWLSSPAASYVTGQALSVDGGSIMR
jgi:NAD(P)-dependent dehydrogenase (short-subunit alcohol dehydrogenase family)